MLMVYDPSVLSNQNYHPLRLSTYSLYQIFQSRSFL